MILKGEDGKYDRIAIYKTKKSTEPIVVIHNDEFVRDVLDEAIKNDEPVAATRDMRVLELAEDGSYCKMWISSSMNIATDVFCSPRELLRRSWIISASRPANLHLGLQAHETLIMKCMHACWEHSLEWQSDALLYLMQNKGYESGLLSLPCT